MIRDMKTWYNVIINYMDESFMLAFVRIPFELDCSDCFFSNLQEPKSPKIKLKRS